MQAYRLPLALDAIAMGSEAALWSFLRERLDPTIDVVRVENSVGPGTPDLNFAAYGNEGWIEMKYRRSYPRSFDKTPVFTKRTGLSKEQAAWIMRRVEAEGVVLILAGVGRFIFLLDGRHASLFNLYALADLAKFAWIVLHRRHVNENTIGHILSHSPAEAPQLFHGTTARAIAELREQCSPRAKAKRNRILAAPPTVRPPAARRAR